MNIKRDNGRGKAVLLLFLNHYLHLILNTVAVHISPSEAAYGKPLGHSGQTLLTQQNQFTTTSAKLLVGSLVTAFTSKVRDKDRLIDGTLGCRRFDCRAQL